MPARPAASLALCLVAMVTGGCSDERNGSGGQYPTVVGHRIQAQRDDVLSLVVPEEYVERTSPHFRILGEDFAPQWDLVGVANTRDPIPKAVHYPADELYVPGVGFLPPLTLRFRLPDASTHGYLCGTANSDSDEYTFCTEITVE